MITRNSNQVRVFYSGTFGSWLQEPPWRFLATLTLWLSWLQLDGKSTAISIFRSTLETLASRVQIPTRGLTYWVDWELGFTIFDLLTSYLDNLNQSTMCQHMCLEYNNSLRARWVSKFECFLYTYGRKSVLKCV